MPPNVRERFVWTFRDSHYVRDPGKWPGRLAAGAVVVVVGLAGCGEYVLQVIAKGH